MPLISDSCNAQEALAKPGPASSASHKSAVAMRDKRYHRHKEKKTQNKTTVTHLHVFKRVLLRDATQDRLLAALLHLSREQQLVENVVRLCEGEDNVELAHVAVVLVHLLYIAVDDFERDQLVIVRRAAGDEEEGCVAAIDDLCVCARMGGEGEPVSRGTREREIMREDQELDRDGGALKPPAPLYSRKLHMRVRRESTSCDTSLTILAFSLGESVENHFARRCLGVSYALMSTREEGGAHTTLPCRESRIRYLN